MESRATKRIRKDDRACVSSSIARSSHTTANEEEESVSTIPTLVSHIFLTNLRDASLLKNCRLVCKSWNIDATASLRACSIVSIKEGCSDNKDIRHLLLERELLENLPSPFQNVGIEGRLFNEPNFMELVLLPNFKITRLKLHSLNDRVLLSQLGSALAANQNNITDLSIESTSPVEPELETNWSTEKFLTQNEIKLKALKTLRFRDLWDFCSQINFVRNIISSCKLERIDLDIRDLNLIKLLTQDKVNNLKDLTLKCSEIPNEYLQYLSNLRFAELRRLAVESGELDLIQLLTQDKVNNLTDLTLKFVEISNENLQYLSNLRFPELQRLSFESYNFPDETSFQQFCQSLSPFLKDFTTNIRISNTSGISLPNLQNIKVQNYTDLSALNPDSFPALSEVYIEVKDLFLNVEKDVMPHYGVHSIVIWVNTLYRDQDMKIADQNLKIFLNYVSRQFPQVSKLVFDIRKFNPYHLSLIFTSFPKLKTLGLDGCEDRLYSWGHNFSATTKFEQQPPTEEMNDREPIVNIMELERIFFGEKFRVNPWVIYHCFPKIAKLRRISLYWNTSITAKLLQESLSHLEKIDISYSRKIQYSKEIAKLSKLPNVRLL